MVEGNEGKIALEDRMYIHNNKCNLQPICQLLLGSYDQMPGGHKEENDFLKFTMSEIIPPSRQPMAEQSNSTMVATKQRLGRLEESEKTQPLKTYWEDLLPPQAPFYCSPSPNDAIILRDMKGLIH